MWVALVIMQKRPDLPPHIMWHQRWNKDVYMIHISPTEGYDVTRDGNIYPIV